MIVRIWRTQVDSARMDEYAAFEREHSTPMFQQLPGCLGALFLRLGEGECAALTFWQDRAAAAAINDLELYRATVKRLQDTGLLQGEQSVEVFEMAAGFISAEVAARLAG